MKKSMMKLCQIVLKFLEIIIILFHYIITWTILNKLLKLSLFVLKQQNFNDTFGENFTNIFKFDQTQMIYNQFKLKYTQLTKGSTIDWLW